MKPEQTEHDIYRAIPSVHQLVESLYEAGKAHDAARSLAVEAAREVLDDFRASLSQKDAPPPADPVASLIESVSKRLAASLRPPLELVINATGIIIHTGLGRAPLSQYAAKVALEAASHYAPVELDMATGQRGRRTSVVRHLLCQLTGAESATVVNNNAAALMIVLASLAKDRGVIVSRGELIEIGGSFRLPDVMKAGGAILKEVGTTNRTRLTDYENAIDENTGALMKVHTSNYRIQGFTEAVTIEELATLGKHHDLPVIDDIGSGALRDLGEYGIVSDEPTVSASLAAGADLVLFSGDKLLGGPQAGIIVGRSDLIELIDKHPMMRALRVDKFTLAALGATLQQHREPERAAKEIPIYACLTAPMKELERRGKELMAKIGKHPEIEMIMLSRAVAYLGGGSTPTEELESFAMVIQPKSISVEEFAQRLRSSHPGVIARIRDGAAWFDLRTVFTNQDEALLNAIQNALTGLSS